MKKELNYSALRFGGYARKSSEDNDKQVQSIDTQSREISDAVTRDGINLVELYTETQSAHTPGRQVFKRLLDDVEKGKLDALIVVRANRLARNPLDAGRIIYLMDIGKLKLIKTTTGQMYKNTPSDKVLLQVEFAFSKKDSDDKSEMVKEGFRTKYLKGLPGGMAPFGFRNTPHLDRGQRYWTIDKDRLEQVRQLFQMFLTGAYSGNKLAEYAINEMKLTTPTRKKLGGKLVKRSYVHYILKNPIYAGFFYVDGVRYELDTKLPRIISPEEHFRVLGMLGEKHKGKFQKHETYFSGFLRSPEKGFMRLDTKFQLICDCGYKFAYRKKETCPKCNLEITKMINPKYLHYRYYYNGDKRYFDRKIKTVSENIVLKKTREEVIDPLSLMPELVDWMKKYLHEVLDQEVKDKLKLQSINQNTETSIEKEKQELRALLRRGAITDDEYKIDLREIESRKPSTNEQTVEVDWKAKINSIVDLGLECKKVFETGSTKAKKEVLFKSQSNLIWDEKNLYITRPLWLEKYIQGVKVLKQNMSTIEPKIISENTNNNKDFPDPERGKMVLDLSLLRELESNQCLQVMSLPRYHFSIPQCFLKAHTNCDF